MSDTALVVLLYLALDVARAGKAGSYSAAAPEPQRSLSLFSLMSRPSLLALARSGSILVWQRLEATRVPLRRKGFSSFLGS